MIIVNCVLVDGVRVCTNVVNLWLNLLVLLLLLLCKYLHIDAYVADKCYGYLKKKKQQTFTAGSQYI